MRTLKVKCPTWEHFETFYKRKLRQDKTLTVRVPFDAADGSTVMLGLQLPDGTVLAIEGIVRGTVAAGADHKAAIKLYLRGLTDDILDRLRTLVADAGAAAPANGTDLSAAAGDPDPAGTSPDLPPSYPEDVPIDEAIAPSTAPSGDQLASMTSDQRAVYNRLDTELRNLRECAAHEVLGVTEDVGVAEVRRAYFACTKRYHPDIFARYGAALITERAQEVFIHINRAYDRMRQSLVASGQAIIAGPALLDHDGWLLGLDDIAAAADDSDDDSRGELPPAGLIAAPAPRGSGKAAEFEALRDAIGRLIAAGEFEQARGRIADALHREPRNRRLRALYYVISGKQAQAGDDAILAATQFEAALAHDDECDEARTALDELRRSSASNTLPRFLR
ncbi:MAG: J domain-containing protein [Myxococcota bacterium]